MILSLPRRLMRHFRAIICVGLVDLLDRRHDRSMRGIIAFELISDQPEGFPALIFEATAEEAFRRMPIAAALQ